MSRNPCADAAVVGARREADAARANAADAMADARFIEILLGYRVGLNKPAQLWSWPRAEINYAPALHRQ
jgi:hypothetical protein